MAGFGLGVRDGGSAGFGLLFGEVGEDDAVATGPLGFIKGDVGGFEDLGGLVGDFGIDGTAEAGGDAAGLSYAVSVVDAGDLFADAFGHGGGGSGVHSGEDEGELFATVAGGEVLFTHIVAEDLGDQAEDFVAGVVAFFLVELAEVVDVDHDHADGAEVALGVFE